MDARSQRVDSLPLPPGLLAQATTRPLAVTLVLPVLDAEKSLARIVRAADDALACATADYEILLVDGGSSDATLDVAAATAAVFPALRVLRADGAGSGGQWRAGIQAAGKEYVALAELNATLERNDLARLALLGPYCAIACGERIDRQDRWPQRVLRRAYSIVVDVLLGTGVRDCQGTLKLARRDTLLSLVPASDSQFLHVELLAKARLAGLPVVEVDVEPRKFPNSQFGWSLGRVSALITETARFWWTNVMFPVADSDGAPAVVIGPTIRPWHVWLLATVAAVFLFARLSFPLIEPDEARYALIAASMLDSGDLLVPQREGSYYLDKPPLLYWLTVASFWALGVHDYAARTVTALAGLGTVLSTFWIGRYLIGKRGAWIGAMLLMLSLGFVLASRFLIMDGLLTLFTTVSLLSLYVATQGSRLHRGWWMLAAVACGLGVMTKGPVALVLTLPPWFVMRWLARDGAVVRVRDSAGYACGVAAVAVPWFMAVTIREPGFLKYFFWEHHVIRYTTNMIHVEPWWFYIPALAIGMFPGSFLLPVLAVYLFRRSNELPACRTRAQGYLLISATSTIGFFSLSTGKLAPYVLPALPMLCLLMGAMFDRAILSENRDKFISRMRRWIPFHGTRVALIAGMVLGVVDFFIDGGDRDQWAESTLFVGGSIFLYWFVSRRKFAEQPARWAFAAAVPMVVLAIGTVDIYPTIATNRSLAARVELAQRSAGEVDMPVVCFGRYEDSLMFYNRDGHVRQFNIEQFDDIRAYIKGHARVVVLTQETYIGTLREHFPEITLEVQAQSRGKIYVASVAGSAQQVTAGAQGESRR